MLAKKTSLTIITALIMSACSTPDIWCKAGYAHTYAYHSGWKQIWSEHGGGVPCP